MAKNLSHFEQDDIKAALADLSHKSVFLGFDAFIDFAASPIRQGNAVKPAALFETIGEWGAYMQEHDGENCSIELLDGKPRIGGNMAITANAISSFGIKTYCVGTFGYPGVHPVFSDMAPSCDLISVGSPGEAIALEFKNGKVILGMNRDVSLLDWETIKARAGLSRIIQCAGRSELLFLLNWSELPGSTGIFRGMREEVLPRLHGSKRLFIDFSDCSRRADPEILEILRVIGEMPPNIRVTLSLNKNEERIICSVLGIDAADPFTRGKKLVKELGLDSVFFHSREVNALVTREDCAALSPELCPTPAINVGAGDNFNAGAAIAMLMELSPGDTLKFAAETAGYFVKNGKSYNFKEGML